MSESLIRVPSIFGDNGNFLLERELGTGGMGGVYMGRDKMLDRPVAVKVMLKELGADAEFVEKFKKEAQAAARLVHPNIVQVYSYGICEGMPYIAMELAAGGSLFSLMNVTPGKADIQRVLKICQQTALALQCATDQGVIHGDVKPENILLDANGNAKLVDFGLAAMQKDTEEIWGTPYYIAPEKVKKSGVDFRSDMYSLGATLYHALTGVAPFEGEDSIAVVKKRFEGTPRKPSEIRPEITPSIDALVMTMIELDRENRYPSFEALLRAFTDVLTSGLTQNVEAAETGDTAVGTKSPVRKRMTVTRGRRVIRKTSSTVATDAADTDAANKTEEGDSDEENESGSIGKKVILFVVGGILTILTITGGLFWFVSAKANERREKEHAQIVAGITQARTRIQEIREHTVKYEADFRADLERFSQQCESFTVTLGKMLPDFAVSLKPPISEELKKAIASTNVVAGPVTDTAVNVTTNAVKTTDVSPSTVAEIPNEKKVEPPRAVSVMNDMWERVYRFNIAQIHVSTTAGKILAECEKADVLKEDTQENMVSLGTISRTVKDLYDQMTGAQFVTKSRSEITSIKSKGANILEYTQNELFRKQKEAERIRIQEEEAQKEKDRLAKKEAERKALEESEVSGIKAKFSEIAEQGCFRQLNWKSAFRQLNEVGQDFKTETGKQALQLQIKKVYCMKKVQDIFIAKLKGYVFKSNKLKGCEVTDVSEKEIAVVNAKSKRNVKIQWQKFYRDFAGNFNEILNHYISLGRKYSSLSLLEWSDSMAGAALTMQLVCFEITGATEKASVFVNEAVKQFPECESSMRQIFPDMELKTADE